MFHALSFSPPPGHDAEIAYHLHATVRKRGKHQQQTALANGSHELPGGCRVATANFLDACGDEYRQQADSTEAVAGNCFESVEQSHISLLAHCQLSLAHTGSWPVGRFARSDFSGRGGLGRSLNCPLPRTLRIGVCRTSTRVDTHPAS